MASTRRQSEPTGGAMDPSPQSQTNPVVGFTIHAEMHLMSMIGRDYELTFSLWRFLTKLDFATTLPATTLTLSRRLNL